MPNIAITAISHWAPSFHSGLILQPATINIVCKTTLPALPNSTTPCILWVVLSLMSFILLPAWPNATYPLGSDFLVTSPNSLSNWGVPRASYYLLLIIVSILRYEYLSFTQPFSHQIQSTLWEGQDWLLFTF